MANLTLPFLKYYANKIGADFIILNNVVINGTVPHYEKFQLYDLLEIYDRILYIDIDVIVTEKCPNLFDIVPIDSFGIGYALNQNKNYNKFANKLIESTQREWGNVG